MEVGMYGLPAGQSKTPTVAAYLSSGQTPNVVTFEADVLGSHASTSPLSYKWEFTTSGSGPTASYSGALRTGAAVTRSLPSGTVAARVKTYNALGVVRDWAYSSLVTYTAPGGGGGGGLPSDYRSGNLLGYVSNTQLTVGSGSYYHPGASAVVTNTTATTLTPTLAASTLYYVYGGSSAATFTVTSTAPVSNYQGTAWEDGSNNRYVGSFVTNSSSHIVPFVDSGELYTYATIANNGDAFSVGNVGNRSPIVSTSISCSPVVPATSRLAYCTIDNTASTGNAFFGWAGTDGITPTTTTGALYIPGGVAVITNAWLRLSTSQAYLFCLATHNAALGVSVYLLGYRDSR